MVIVTNNYGEAGAIDRYGPDYGLPPVYSGQNELYVLGPPPDDRTLAIVWAQGTGILEPFDDCTQKATLDNGFDVDNEEQGSRLFVCHVPPAGWVAIWPRLQHYD